MSDKDKFDWDNLKLRGRDAKFISLTEPWEEDWPKILEVKKEVLEKAIKETNSHSLLTIAKWFKKNNYK